MSNFNCEKCGLPQIDSYRGYVVGCSHYPPDNSRIVLMKFGGDRVDEGFYWEPEGSWYRSEKSKAKRNAVHPVAWTALDPLI